MGEIKLKPSAMARRPVSLWDLVTSLPALESDEFDRVMRERDENPAGSLVSPPPDWSE